MLVETPAAGDRIINLELSGYASLELPLTLQAGEVVAVEAELAATGMEVLFQNAAYIGPGGSISPPGGYSLPPGNYSLNRSGEGPIFAPDYPHQRWISGLNIAIPVVSALTAGVMIAEASNPSTAGVASPFTISAAAADLALIAVNAALIIRRSRWRESWRADPAAAASQWADEDFTRAERDLESGNWDQARSSLDRFAARYPMDDRTPEALYRSARLAYVQDDLAVCAERLGVLNDRYPVPRIWGRVQRLRADLAFRSGRIDDGLTALDSIYGFDDAVDLEAIAYQKAVRLTELSRETGNRNRALEAWDVLIENWSQSSLINEYLLSRDRLIP
jgi:tetratricopeptide (TPR) repeat protein